MGSIELFNGDCLEIMKDIPDASVDLVICDLPYGQLARGDLTVYPDRILPTRPQIHDRRTAEGCAWDEKLDLVEFWKQIKRIRRSDNTPCIHFCNTRFGIDLINSNLKEFRFDLVWNKLRGISFLSVARSPMKSHEMIYVFSKKGAFYTRIDEKTDKKNSRNKLNQVTPKVARQYGFLEKKTAVLDTCRQYGKPRTSVEGYRCALSVLNFPNAGRRGGHPTEKSIDLYKWLISRFCPPGGTLLDPTAGSFNSCIAGAQLGMNCIGIEKDPDFYATAENRLAALSTP